jgi:hypothetical protein
MVCFLGSAFGLLLVSGGELAEDGRAEWHAAVAGGGISD